MRKFSFILFVLILFIFSCTTQKNTVITRAYHNLTAHYNVFFNGKMALQDAIRTINQQCKYDFNNLLPVFPYECPNAKNLAGTKLNRTLEKAAKTITNHSITVKPKFKDYRHLTPAQKAFYKKKEYVKWIDDSYLLIAIANVYKGELSKSQQALHKILDTYKGENTIPYAKIWLARTYILQNRFKDAEPILTDLTKQKNLNKKVQKQVYLTLADFYIHKKDYAKAIEPLQKAIKLEKNRRLKAKYTFLLAQLYLYTGDKKMALKYFKKVNKYNPPYELSFYSQLYQATALSPKDNPNAIKKRLLKMLKDEKNEDYLDKIYYTLAQLELNHGDTAQAIEYFKSAIANSSDPTQKGLTYLTLADIFFKQQNYLIAGKYYDSTLRVLPQTYKDYKKIKLHSKALISLAKNLEIVATNDSLIRLADLPKQQLYAIIDSIIQTVKEKQQQQTTSYGYDPLDIESQRYASGMPTQQSQGGKWYFYNPMLISRGKQLFRQRWGDRKLEDNWRLKNKNPVNTGGFDTTSNPQNKPSPDKLTSREYYLKQIPFSDSAKAALKQKNVEALFNVGLIYENQINDYQKAAYIFETLLKKYPQNKYQLDCYYHLYILYKKLGNYEKSNFYKNKIISEYPNTLYAKILKDPQFLLNMKKNELKAERLLLHTINEYENLNYQNVIDSANLAISKYNASTIIPNMLYLKAKAYGSLGNTDSLTNILQQIIDNYPNSSITPQAKKLLNDIKTGKLNPNVFKADFNKTHYVLFIINDKNNLNKIKFQIFKFANEFSQNQVFTTDVIKLGNKQAIVLKQFNSAQDALQFINYLKSNWAKPVKWYLITPENLQTLQKNKNLLLYEIFYNRTYKQSLQ